MKITDYSEAKRHLEINNGAFYIEWKEGESIHALFNDLTGKLLTDMIVDYENEQYEKEIREIQES